MGDIHIDTHKNLILLIIYESLLLFWVKYVWGYAIFFLGPRLTLLGTFETFKLFMKPVLVSQIFAPSLSLR